MSIQSVNPATGEVLETLEETSPQQIDRILAGAQAAFTEWRTRPFAERATRPSTR
jgi:succinate-semialdehyde dehydrogenase/glutarate-semialdehyde dehydrogenase